MQLFTIPPLINLALTASATLVVIWRGGWRERTLALTMLLTILPYGVSVCALQFGRSPWQVPEPFLIVVGVGHLSLCLAFALRSDRYWTIWASALGVLSVATYVAKGLMPEFGAWAYASAQIVWCYLVLVVLLVAAWQSDRARRRPEAASGGLAGRPG